MFVQVIQGQVPDAEEMRGALDRWTEELSPGASGWLGTTAGVTDDGMFVALVRFDSEEAARRNSGRPEQDRWWAETAKLFAGEATFRDSSDVQVDTVGDPDRAGFVQVMQGRGTDPERARELIAQDSREWASFRPDVVGSVAIQHEGGAYTMAIYFTSEEEAREGERKEPPPAMQKQMEELNSLNVGVPQFLDIRQPWLYSPH
ncbi:hypothetical protein [Phytohabitans rumicis]|uniref:hypothetical protein n=1 Tax=Phytohabitans rumicis TaxID=1076125 RepID=UPI0031F04AB4